MDYVQGHAFMYLTCDTPKIWFRIMSTIVWTTCSWSKVITIINGILLHTEVADAVESALKATVNSLVVLKPRQMIASQS